MKYFGLLLCLLCVTFSCRNNISVEKKIIVHDYNNKNIENLYDFVHPQYGVSYGYVKCDHNSDKTFSDISSYPDFLSFDTLQQFSNNFPQVDCSQPKQENLPQYMGEGSWTDDGCFWNEVNEGEIKVVSSNNIYEFYFKSIQANWFLIRIEKLECK